MMTTNLESRSPIIHQPSDDAESQVLKRMVWSDQFGRIPNQPGFSPTPRQQALMQLVQAALDEGLIYTQAIDEHVLRAMGIHDGQFPYDGFSNDVYDAKKAVESKRKFEKMSEIAKQFRLTPETKLGTLVFNDGKRVTNVRVVDVGPNGCVYKISGQRGPVSIHGSLDAFSIKWAMDRAHREGRRADGFDSFVSRRAHLPETSVIADPLEPFYKTESQKQVDIQAANEIRAQVVVYRKRAEACALMPESLMIAGLVAERHLVEVLFNAKAAMLGANADVLFHSCSGGGIYADLLSEAEKAKYLYESALHQIESTYPQWELNLARVDEAFEAEKLEKERLVQEAIQLREQQAAADSPQVIAFARVIAQSIERQAVAAAEKSYREKVAKGYITQEQAGVALNSLRNSWQETKINDRILILARAIDQNDPRPLVEAWAKQGQGVSGNEGSIKAFTEISGINLLKLNSTDRSLALYQWAHWSDEQIAQERLLINARQAQRDAAYAQKIKAEHQSYVTKKAQQCDLSTPEGVVTILAYVDGLISQGFRDVYSKKVGAATKTYLVNSSTGAGYLMKGEAMIEYAKVAAGIAAINLQDDSVNHESAGDNSMGVDVETDIPSN